MTDVPFVELNEEVALIGAEGWYDARLGNPQYLRATFDWILTEDFRQLPNWDARLNKFRQLATDSAEMISQKLQLALDKGYKTVYILTHFPPFKEATRDEGTILEDYYLPYNTNLVLGNAIEKIMEEHKKRNAVCLTGHSHSPQFIRVSRNIHCQVGAAKLFDVRSQTIFL
jgi:predicted phosphohydrolase